MSVPVWVFPIYVAIWAWRVHYSFGPTRRGEFTRQFPGRRTNELMEVIGGGVAGSLLPFAFIASEHWGLVWLLPFVVVCLLQGLMQAVLSRRARRAGEPTWTQWKRDLGASPAAAA